MPATTAWRRWRREVHDILEVGGDAHPAGRVVNAFIILLIFLNAIAFAAETVKELDTRYAVASRSSTSSRWPCSPSNMSCGWPSTSRC